MSDEREEQSIAITDFAPADEAATLAFCRQIFHEEGWPTEFMDPTIAAGFDRPRDVFLLAKLHGAIIGCGALKELSTDDALLTRFFVASSHRGSGLADEAVRRAVRARPRAGLHHGRARRESGECPRHPVLPEARHGGVYPRAPPPLAGIGPRGASVRDDIFGSE